jgi:hypothetical protein
MTLQPLPILAIIWVGISMDFIVGLPKARKQIAIMVVTDHLSKYSYFYALCHPFNPSTVEKFFMDHIFKLDSMPNSIMMYHDPTFTNKF